MAELPFGRGYRSGPDARVAQAESWDRRSRDIAREDEWLITPMNMLGGDTHGATGYAQELRLFPIPRLTRTLKAKSVRIRVTTSSAGSLIRVAMYQYNSNTQQGKQFLKLPLSEALFSGAATGVKEEDLAQELTLLPDTYYFMGAFVSNNSVGLVSDANTSHRVIPVNVVAFDGASNTLPGNVPQSSLTKSYAKYFPWVVYLSSVGADVI